MNETKQPTVLTNLQRGNVKQESPMLLHQRTLHELAAQGELYNIEPNVIDEVDSNYMTPLLWAAGYGQNSTVEFLIRSGANPNHKSSGGRTALMFAASKGFYHVVRTLVIDGADPNQVDESGNSALMYAAHQNHGLAVQELLRNGADLGVINVYGHTAYSISLTKNNRSALASIEAHLISLFKGSWQANFEITNVNSNNNNNNRSAAPHNH